MLYKTEIDNPVDTIQFELDLVLSRVIYNNERYQPCALKLWVTGISEEFKDNINKNEDLFQAIKKLRLILEAHESKPIPDLGKKVIKDVYFMLVNDQIRPRVEGGSTTVTVLLDEDLVEGMSDQTGWARVDMARNRKFIESLIARYKPDNKDELISLFTTPKVS